MSTTPNTPSSGRAYALPPGCGRTNARILTSRRPARSYSRSWYPMEIGSMSTSEGSSTPRRRTASTKSGFVRTAASTALNSATVNGGCAPASSRCSRTAPESRSTSASMIVPPDAAITSARRRPALTASSKSSFSGSAGETAMNVALLGRPSARRAATARSISSPASGSSGCKAEMISGRLFEVVFTTDSAPCPGDECCDCRAGCFRGRIDL